ncbi:MAG: UDP-N-acetylglucosamine--N-acetylmuramyl-(pentapeptide) pyrophosphoryl-undecaprenol N-acetylglucosamine transferase, partial [Opitutales bacterium]
RTLPRQESRRALGLPEEGPMVLVLGGSQGAAALTRWAESSLPELSARGIHLLCLTGPSGRDGVERHGSVTARFMPFCDRMAEAYSSADIAVSRAGAGTLAELAACRTPAVLVPLPSAADDHQSANAAALVERGAALMTAQADLSGLTAIVTARLADPDTLVRMRAALAEADAANRWDDLPRHVAALAGEGRDA